MGGVGRRQRAVRVARVFAVIGAAAALAACPGPPVASPAPSITPGPPAPSPVPSPDPSPAAAPTDPETGYTVPVALWRPLRAPAVGDGGSCPTDIPRAVNPGLAPLAGPGPVYPAGLDARGRLDVGGPGGGATDFGGDFGGQKVMWTIDRAYLGPVLIRGVSLDGRHPVRFWRGPEPPGSMQLPPNTTGATAPGIDWRLWPSYTRVRANGCYAWQVDGLAFSYTIVFQAV